MVQMKKSMLWQFVPLGFILAIGMIYFFFAFRKASAIDDMVGKEYPPISYSEELYGRITETLHENEDYIRNTSTRELVIVNDTIKKQISALSAHDRAVMLDAVIKVGSHISKAANSSQLLIVNIQGNDSTIYEFELRTGMGYPLNRE
jgi:hypothetical protein